MDNIRYSLGLFLLFIFSLVIALAVLWACTILLHTLLTVRSSRVPRFLVQTAQSPVRLPLAAINLADRVLRLLVGPSMHDKPSRIRRWFRWPARWPFMRLALIYWVCGVSLAMYFLPSNPESGYQSDDTQIRAQNRVLILLAVHIWLWLSALIDSASFNFTRHRIQEFRTFVVRRKLPQSFGILRKDVCVAGCCLFMVLFISNHTYYLTAIAANSEIRGQYLNIALNPRTVVDGNFASPGQRPIPGILITALTCYIPTALWLASAIVAVTIIALSEFKREIMNGWRAYAKYLGIVAHQSYQQKRDWGKCAALFGAGLAGLASGVELLG